MEKAAGFQTVQVADKLDYAQYAAVSVRLPELPGVAPARGFSRYYPAGAAVGHLIGYVGIASAEDYEKSKDPLLITPGFRSEEHTSELQSLIRKQSADFRLQTNTLSNTAHTTR